MKTIPLTHGKFTIVDDNDYPLLATHKWRALKSRHTWYAIRSAPDDSGRHTRTILMHRALLNPLSGAQTDHVDGDGLNNQRSNLRVATCQQNGGNRPSYREGKFKGVFFKRGYRRPWIASLCNHYLGCFSSPEEAAAVYDTAARRLWGDFALTNLKASF